MKEIPVGDLPWIKVDLDDLGMIPKATVGRRKLGATGIAYPCSKNPWLTPELGVRAPESAHSETRCFETFSTRRLQWLGAFLFRFAIPTPAHR